MKEYIVNFSDAKSYNDFYDCLIKGLAFPSWCGKNADAIWDMLTGYTEYPSVIFLSGTKALNQELQEEWEKIRLVFEDLLKKYKDNRFRVVIR